VATTSVAGVPLRPVRLAPNLIDHFYEGGARIAALRGIETTSTHQPEEGLAATVARAGEDGIVGLARTADGVLLRDLVADDPQAWRGAGPRGGIDDDDTGLLLKLLDAGQRLPVHVHPDRAFASSHLGCPYGKTEAWYVLDAEPGAAVHLGWTEDVDPEEVAQRRDVQDGAWMLERMHRLDVQPGDGVLVPAGQVHAIGAGVFVAEAQEPTDFSIILEWSVTTSGREDSHLGLGFDAVMPAVSHAALSERELDRLVLRGGAPSLLPPGLQPVLPPEAAPFFRIDLAVPGAPVEVAAGFAVLLVLDGAGALRFSSGDTVELDSGEVWAVPAACGDCSVAGEALVLLARPGVGWPDSLVP
jgi:mannose-6-phosphate isomerase